MDLDGAAARMHLENYAVPDFGNLRNGLTGGSSVPATVSFDVRWSGMTKRGPRNDDELRFTGDFILGNATTAWSSRQSGFTYVSDAIETSKSQSAVIGRERNGIFYALGSTPSRGPSFIRRLGDG